MIATKIVTKWIMLWEHEFNERFEEFKSVLGEEVIDSLPDRLNLKECCKGRWFIRKELHTYECGKHMK